MSLFKRRNIDEYTDSLAAYLPGGDLFTAKSIKDSNFRKLLKGLACELFRSNGYLREFGDEIIPDKTNKFLAEWESALGIPDGCFTGSGANDERRRDILVKLAALGVQTVDEFEELALVFGKIVTVSPLASAPFPPYEVPFTPIGLPAAKFVILVEGVDLFTDLLPPYDVPFIPTIGESLLECIFRKLKPANCDIVFRNSD